jgi:uncharacterized membrane protein YphA (DoxX/SURF4 family)
MEVAVIVGSVVIALGIVNVWLLRFGKSTSYRGCSATNMKEEFEAYGMPGFAVWAIGGLKLLLAAGLVVGIWVPDVRLPAATAMAVLMLGAIAMHLRVKDPLVKSLPAFIMLALSVFVAIA